MSVLLFGLLFLAFSCEQLPQLDSETEQAKNPLIDYVEITDIRDILVGMVLEGTYVYPGLVDTAVVVSTDIQLNSLPDGGWECFLVFFLDDGFHSPTREILEADLIKFEPDREVMEIWWNGLDYPLLTLQTVDVCGLGGREKGLQADFDFSRIYSMLFGSFVDPIRNLPQSVLVSKELSLVEWLAQEWLSFTLFSPQLPAGNGMAMRQECRIELSFYENHSRPGFTCQVNSYVRDFSQIGAPAEYSKTFYLPHVLVNDEEQEVWAYETTVDNKIVPYMRIKYYKDLSRLILYWTPGSYFKKKYQGLVDLPLCEEELQIILSQKVLEKLPN